jgi:hypothetical protein
LEAHANRSIDAHISVFTRVREKGILLTRLLLAHYEDGTVSVPYNGVGDAPHKRPPYSA